MAPSALPAFDIEHTIARLTLEEKARLLTGSDFWHTPAIDRDGVHVPSVMLADGPHGVRKQKGTGEEAGLIESWPATCFPTAVSLGSTWDTDLVTRVGKALGRESRALGLTVLLGPGANIKRDPRCGRNFEYLSEDPVLSGDLAAALINGIQSQGVGASLKHFAANNQESDRMRVSAEVDERTLREIYLASFERAVKGSNPWTVMCSYNRINGTYSSQNRWLLTEVLRDDWGWDGVVVSDWGATRDRVAGVAAGLDLEMPATGGRTTALVIDAVRDGTLDEALVDIAVRRVLTLVSKSGAAAADAGAGVGADAGAGTPGATSTTPVDHAAHHLSVREAQVDHTAHHLLAREAASAGAVLLRNEPVGPDATPLLPLLPLKDRDGVAVIGEFARTPRYQGAGSSQVNPTELTSALDAFADLWGTPVPFAPGFALAEGPATDATPVALRDEAVRVAAGAHTVVVFLGLPAATESEGYDRDHLSLPADQLALLDALAKVNERIVVVLSNGSAVTLSEWQHHAPAVIEAWLSGQAGGAGIVDLLTGVTSPSGRLAETLPVRLEDVPAYGAFPGELNTVRYGEGIFVGYRHYDLRDAPVAYPFGFGLTYTTFTIDDVEVVATGTGADARVTVTATVTNTGHRKGAEVVQVYIGDPESLVTRPVRELKGFARVALEPGESRTVTLELDSRALAFWHPTLGRWTVEGGTFTVEVGSSSRDIAATVSIEVEGEDLASPLSELSTMGELRAHPATVADAERLCAGLDPTMLSMVDDFPLVVLADFGMISGFDRDQIASLIATSRA